MKRLETAIPGVCVLEPQVFHDARGYFMETWNSSAFALLGIHAEFVQDNHSHSIRGTLRGLHFQRPHAQGKLVRVTSGEIFDVAVDLRPESEWFGQWVGVTLSADNCRQLWIPEGFAHGFYTVSAAADLVYKCTDYYARDSERTIRWDDKALAIRWPLSGVAPILSPKDAAGLSFEAACAELL